MKLDFIQPLVPFLPEVQSPARPPTLTEKILWTSIVLILFFVMYHVVPFGAELRGGQFVEFIQTVLASRTGTLLTIGIGPIILASIFLQLFAGAKILEVNMQDPKDKALFNATQKTLAIALAIIETILFVMPGVYLGPDARFSNPGLIMGLIIAQVAFTSIILMFLDEVVSKYGIGSGISLFIAAGVALAVVQGSFTLIFGGVGVDAGQTVMGRLAAGGATAIPNALIAFLPIIFMFVIIVLSLYAEGIKVEISRAYYRGIPLQKPIDIKFLLVSVLPVILTSALLMNVQLLSRSLLYNANWDLGGVNVAQYLGVVDANGSLRDGLLYFISPLQNPLYVGSYEGYLAQLAGSTPIFGIPEWLHVIVYAIIYILLCIVFGKFWSEAQGISPDSYVEQLHKSGITIGGMRSDPRIMKMMVGKYISAFIVLGSAFVGLLAVLADVTGAIGTGTGILLTVGIMHKFYEDFKQQNLLEMYPGIQKFLGL